METEIREMLRSKAGDAVLSPVIPVETVSRANRRRAFVGTAVGLAVAAVVVGVIVGVNSLGNRRTIGFDDQPIEPKRKLSIELFQGPYGIVEGFDSVWVAGHSDVARVDPRTGAVKRTITFTSAPRVVNGTTEQDFYEVLPRTLTVGEGAVWVLGQKRGTQFSATAQPLAPSDGPEPAPSQTLGTRTEATFSMEASALGSGSQDLGASQAQLAVDTWSLIRIDPRSYRWTVVGTVPQRTQAPPVHMRAGERGIWVAMETGSGAGEVHRYSPTNGEPAGRISVGGVPMGIAIEGGSVYVPLAAADGGKVVAKINGAANRVSVSEIAIPDAAWAFSIAAADGDVWVAVDSGAERGAPYRLARIDARSGRVLGTIQVPYIFSAMSIDGGTLWGISEGDETLVQRIVGNTLAGTLTTKHKPVAILSRDGSLWAGTAESELTLTRYDF